ncbi:hypothetical protein NKJ59_11035 [Mesorhizobium australicum]|uniref:hypothetical protein n=1 Tax=Mesorhizobium australicum TaxID=536018 RepID=UPI00333D6D99
MDFAATSALRRWLHIARPPLARYGALRGALASGEAALTGSLCRLSEEGQTIDRFSNRIIVEQKMDRLADPSGENLTLGTDDNGRNGVAT